MTLPFKKPLTVSLLACCMLLMSGCLPDAHQVMAAVTGSKSDGMEMTVDTVSAGNGAPMLYCRAGKGTARFGQNDWFDFSDAAFRLHSGERVNVSFYRVRSMQKMTIQALFDKGGQKMIFCPVPDAPHDQRILCASMYTLEDDLQTGFKRTLDIPNAVRGGAITCAYDEGNLKSLVTPGSGGD